MSLLNDSDFMNFAFKEAIAREKRISVKLKFYYQTSRDKEFKNLCVSLLSPSQSRINILQKEAKNLNLRKD